MQLPVAGLRFHSLTQPALYTTRNGTDLVTEDLPGYLERFAGGASAAMGSLHDRLLELIPVGDRSGAIDVYWPFFPRSVWKRREQELRTAIVRPGFGDSIRIDLACQCPVEAAVAAGICAALASTPVTYRPAIHLSLEAPAESVAPLASRLRFDLSAIRPHATVKVDVELSMPAEAFGAWFDLPPARTTARFHVLAAISAAVQDAMRAWLPLFAMNSIDAYADPVISRAMAVYRASHSVQPRSRSEFAREVTERRASWTLYHAARPRVPAEFRRVQLLLLAAGRSGEAAAFSGRPAREFAARGGDESAPLLPVLRAELMAFDALFGFAEACREAGSRPQAAQQLWKTPARLAKDLQRPLRWLFAGKSHTRLAPFLLFEGTAALLHSLGKPVDARARISLGYGSGDKTVEISGAIFGRLRPLPQEEIAV